MMLGLAIAVAVQAVEPAPVTGFYISRTMEVGSAIELDPDGKFMFALDYGAISEAAEGNWVREGNTIYLTATRHEMNWQAPKFDRTPMRVEGNDLLLERHDRSIRYEIEQPLAPPPARKNAIEP